MNAIQDPVGNEPSRRLRTIAPTRQGHTIANAPGSSNHSYAHHAHADHGPVKHTFRGAGLERRPPRSLLALSGVERLALVVPAVIAIWLLVLWAIL
ncbi:hypothetical protein MCEMSEM23_01599 [Rhabdaerophilaceae bacterium]